MFNPHDRDTDPEPNDEDDRAFQEELFRRSKLMGYKPEDLKDKEFAALYAEWLKTQPSED